MGGPVHDRHRRGGAEHMARTSDAEVRAVLDERPTKPTTQFISQATKLVDWLERECAPFSTLTEGQKRDVETNLAAHFWARRDKQYSTESDAGASGSYQGGQIGKYFEGTFWGQQAIELDPSGCLAKLQQELVAGMKQKATMNWLGKTVTETLRFDERN